MSEPAPTKIFLSYSAAGDGGTYVREIAGWIRADLEPRGYEVWSFEDDGVAGRSFVDEYADQVRRWCDAMVLLVSEGSLRSRHVHTELALALARDDIRIVPVQVDTHVPFPVLEKREIGAFSFVDRPSRVELLHRLLVALEHPDAEGASPGRSFRTMRRGWRLYRHDPSRYPLCVHDRIQLVGTPSERMDVQSERDVTFARLKVRVHSALGWRTDTSVGFEKWYGRRRFSIALQGDGHVWVRHRGWLGQRHRRARVEDWVAVRSHAFVLEIDWGSETTSIRIDGRPIYDARTEIRRPLKVRFNVDRRDDLTVDQLELVEH